MLYDNHMEDFEIMTQQSYKVAKSNSFIRRAKAGLPLGAQKVLNFCISKIKPYSTELKPVVFSIQDFLGVFGLDKTSGENYRHVKQWCQQLRDTSWYYKRDDDTLVTMSFISRVEIKLKSGVVKMIWDEGMAPFLTDLASDYTQYELGCIVHFSSSATEPLYSLLKSHAYTRTGAPAKTEFDIPIEVESLKFTFGVGDIEYKRLRERYIDAAIKDMNKSSDIDVSYTTKKRGRSVQTVVFHVRKLEALEYLQRQAEYQEEKSGVRKKDHIPGQTTIYTPLETSIEPLDD